MTGAPATAAWNTSGRRSTASAARKPPKLQPRMATRVRSSGCSLGGVVQRGDLVVEHRRGEVEVHGALPRRPAPGGAAPVGDDHGEALVGEPLRRQVGVVGLHDAGAVRSAVRVEQHRERRAVVVVGEQHGGGDARLAGERELDVGAQRRHGGVADELDAVERLPLRTGLGERRRAHDHRAAADGDAVHAGLVGEGAQRAVGVALPDLDRRGVVDGVGGERDARRRRSTATDRTWRSAGVTGSPPTSSRRAPSRSAHVTTVPSGSSPGTPATSSTQTSSWSSKATSVAPVPGSTRSTCTARWSRDWTVAMRPASDQRTSARYGSCSRSHSTSTIEPSRAMTCSVTSALGVPAAGYGSSRGLDGRVGRVTEVPALDRRGVDAGDGEARCRPGSTSSRGSGPSPRRR